MHTCPFLYPIFMFIIIKIAAIRSNLTTIPAVLNVHDLHVWAVTSDFPTLTCHIAVGKGANAQQILREATNRIKEQFHIEHVTIQIEEDMQHCENEEQCEVKHD